MKHAIILATVALATAGNLSQSGAQSVPASMPGEDRSAYILTPPTSHAPRFNGPSVFGVRPGRPILYHVPVSGDRPLVIVAGRLPPGVAFDPDTAQLIGSVDTAGTYEIHLFASNVIGGDERKLKLVVGDTIGLTPPMGWNSYNVWSDQITQDRALAAAKAMVDSGLIEHGWTYINMDDGWQGQRTGPDHVMQPDPKKFPDIKAMVEQVHAMGLKMGIYSSPWVMTYAGRPGGSAENPEGTVQRWPTAPKNEKKLPFAIGQFQFTETDARQFADWGFDYLKYDWGPVEYPETKEMWEALRRQDRDIFFSVSNNHIKNLFKDIGDVSTVCNAWRTTTDITDNWGRVSTDIGFNQDAWAPFGKPGHYNDADMLVVGVVGWGAGKQHPSKLTPDEQFTHISMWCLLSSPLLLGCDMTKLDRFTLSLLTNDEVLAVDQDALVSQAVSVAKNGAAEVYRKQMEDGSLVAGLFNRGSDEAQVMANWADLKIKDKQKVRDLWRQKDLGTFDDHFSAQVPPHGVVLVKIQSQGAH